MNCLVDMKLWHKWSYEAPDSVMVRAPFGWGRWKMSWEKMRPSWLIPPGRGLIWVEVLGKRRKDSLVRSDPLKSNVCAIRKRLRRVGVWSYESGKHWTRWEFRTESRIQDRMPSLWLGPHPLSLPTSSDENQSNILSWWPFSWEPGGAETVQHLVQCVSFFLPVPSAIVIHQLQQPNIHRQLPTDFK